MRKKTCDIFRVTQALAAEVLGITDRGLRKLVRAPRNRDGTYNLVKLVQWRIRELEAEHAAEREAGGSRDKVIDSLRETNRQIRLIELESLRGRYVDAGEVEQGIRTGLGVLQEQLIGLAQSLAPRLTGLVTEEIATEMESEIRTKLEDLSARFERMGREGSAGRTGGRNVAGD